MKQILLCLIFMAVPVASFIHANESSQGAVIRIGVSEIPPFVMFDGDVITGVSVDLWRTIADSLQLDFRYIKFANYLDLMTALQNGDVDLTINPVTLTDNRLKYFRLSIPFYTSRLALAQRPSGRIPILTVFLSLMNWRSLQLIILLSSVVLIFALLVWLAERRHNSTQFRKDHRGIADGIWWAFVTMTTVGYGDKIPKTKLGRGLTLVWMFYAIALLFIFTAEISSELTVTKLQGDMDTVEELRKIKVGTLEQTGFSAFCDINRIQYIPFADQKLGLNAVTDRKIEAFVGDYATLASMFERFKLGKNLVLNPTRLNEQYFCFGANRNYLDLIDRINPILLDVTESADWVEILLRNGIRE